MTVRLRQLWVWLTAPSDGCSCGVGNVEDDHDDDCTIWGSPRPRHRRRRPGLHARTLLARSLSLLLLAGLLTGVAIARSPCWLANHDRDRHTACLSFIPTHREAPRP